MTGMRPIPAVQMLVSSLSRPAGNDPKRTLSFVLLNKKVNAQNSNISVTQSKKMLWYFLGITTLVSTIEVVIFAIDLAQLPSAVSLTGVVAYFMCFFGFTYFAVEEKVPFKYLLIFRFLFFGYVVNPIFWMVQSKRMGIMTTKHS